MTIIIPMTDAQAAQISELILAEHDGVESYGVICSARMKTVGLNKVWECAYMHEHEMRKLNKVMLKIMETRKAGSRQDKVKAGKRKDLTPWVIRTPSRPRKLKPMWKVAQDAFNSSSRGQSWQAAADAVIKAHKRRQP